MTLCIVYMRVSGTLQSALTFERLLCLIRLLEISEANVRFYLGVFQEFSSRIACQP